MGEDPQTVEDKLDLVVVELLCEQFKVKLKVGDDPETLIPLKRTYEADDPKAKPRGPLVAVMGHVDHGKTTLLDSLRESSVATGEAGGITQSLGAFLVKMPGGESITFLDTPGHEAFARMRERGAGLTDIAVLVVCAAEGVKTQTIEAANSAKAAGVPVVVAITKIDLSAADPRAVKEGLLALELVAEEYGGDTQVVEVSAHKRLGLEELEQAILLQSEMLELRCNAKAPGLGSIVEARVDKHVGPCASLVVKDGTFKQGDFVVAGGTWGRVKALVDAQGKRVKATGPCSAVEAVGWKALPEAGQPVMVVPSEVKAREISDALTRHAQVRRLRRIAELKNTAEIQVPFILKGDSQGTIEALTDAVCALGTDNVRVAVVSFGVGRIEQSDVDLAETFNAQIVSMAAPKTSTSVLSYASQRDIEITAFHVIYEAVDHIEAQLLDALPLAQEEIVVAKAEVLQTFIATDKAKSTVAGCSVLEGTAKTACVVFDLIRNERWAG